MQSPPLSGQPHSVCFLVIDTGPGTYQHLERILEKCPEAIYALTWCHDIQEAMEELAGYHEEQSLRLPRYGLGSLTRRIHGHAIALPDPLIVVGSDLSPDEVQQLVEAGAMDYIARDQLTLHYLQRLLDFSARLTAKERALRYLSDYDQETGTLNRERFIDHLAHLTQLAEAQGGEVGLMRLSIDGLRRLSHSLGCEIGQQALHQVSRRLKSCLHGTQELGRLGDDQFAIALLSSKADAELWALCQRIEKLKARPYRGADRSIILGCSMGCAVSTQVGSDSATLMRNAGIAMHLAEEESGSSYRFFQVGQDHETTQQLILEPELIRALKSNELVLHYQPRFDLKSDRIVGAEALVRWNHPTRGLIYPGDFIPLAEKNGLIVPLGYWVVYQVGEDLKQLRAQGTPLPRVGINLSFRQFQDENLLSTIQNLLEKQQFEDGQLEFELTETAMALNEQHTRDCIRKLSKYGVAFSLDDFGTGYSSFTHLQKLPISTLKVDRSFVQGVVDSPDDAQIVKAVIDLAHNLRMDVIAEGAETPEQVQFLCDNGCDQVQGYFFSQPCTLEALSQRLMADRAAVLTGSASTANTSTTNTSTTNTSPTSTSAASTASASISTVRPAGRASLASLSSLERVPTKRLSGKLR